ESFFADGIYLGGPRVHRGSVTVGRTTIGDESFFGNHVVIPAGTVLPNGVLLGVCTVANAEVVGPNSSWFGDPPLRLPHREVIELDRRWTHDPTWIRRFNRRFWETLRVTLPAVPILSALLWFAGLSWSARQLSAESFGVSDVGLAAGVLVPFWNIVIATGSCLLVLALKWFLLGRVAPGQHALWSCWCSRWDFLYVAWGAWARGALSAFEGTLLLPWYLRAMGARIGRRTLLGGGFAHVVDPDMLDIRDGATVNGLFQAHSFEDRVLKTDVVRIDPGASVGANSVLLYGAHLEDESRVAPHSVVMKRERIPARHEGEGCPLRVTPIVTGDNPSP
ncbi:MAG: amino acid adenylation protein, partial [Planctomycetota bacterium]